MVWPYDATGSTWPHTVSTSSTAMSSTLWLFHDFGSWSAALKAAESLRPRLLSKPRITRVGDRWMLKYQPRIYGLNGAA